MQHSFKYFVPLLLVAIIQMGCATNRQKQWAATGTFFAAGLGIGGATAPANERKELHSLYWGSLLGLVTSLVVQEIFNDKDDAERLKIENQKLGLQLDLIQNANTILLKEGKGYFKSSTGVDLFSNGKAQWRLYQIDKWQKNGPNQIFHMDRMVELVPLDGESK